MKILPFPCIRPAQDRVGDALSQVPATVDELKGALADGIYVKDGNPGYYICELSSQGQAQTAVVGICSLEELGMNGTGSSGSRDYAQRILNLACQFEPAVVTYPNQPVLDFILSMAKTATPVYSLSNGSQTLCVWEVLRKDAVDSIHAMFEQIDVAGTSAGDSASLLAAKQIQAGLAASSTGKEPHNFCLAALVPASSAQEQPAGFSIPNGLLLHQIKRF